MKDLGRVANGGPAAIPPFVPLQQYLAIKEKGNNELRAASTSGLFGQQKGPSSNRGLALDSGPLRFEVSLDEKKQPDANADRKSHGGDGKRLCVVKKKSATLYTWMLWGTLKLPGFSSSCCCLFWVRLLR